MTTRNLFGLALRIMTIWAIGWALWNIIAGVIYIPESIIAFLRGKFNWDGTYAYFGYGIPIFLGGVLVLRYAECIVRFTYREKTESPPPDETPQIPN